MHLISLMRILKQILCWSHLLLLAIFVCISMIPVSVICEANNETHNVTGNMATFVTNADILDNNKTKEQVATEQHSVNYFIYIGIVIVLVLIVRFVFFREFATIVEYIINIIGDLCNNLGRMILDVLNIRNVFTFFPVIARFAPVPQNGPPVHYVNRINGHDAVIFN